MQHYRSRLFLALLPLGLAMATPLVQRNNRQGIEWGPCDPATVLNNTVIQCATLSVPLDYTDTSCNTTLSLELTRIPSMSSSPRGSIILNFGGPGEDGHINMAEYEKFMGLAATGGEYDLISFDPRGTGRTLPYSCFKNDTKGAAASNYLNTTWYNSSDTAPGHLWTAAKIVADSCYESLKEYGDLVGVAFTSRDMMQIVDALNEDGMLRYWGISGGTILGATVAAMFPDRMDKVLLDGVVNSHEYYHTFGQPEMFFRVDATFEALLVSCVKTPNLCSLGRNRTLDNLRTSIAKTIQDHKYRPGASNGIIVDDSIIKYNIASNLYAPSGYPTLIAALESLLAGDLDTFLRLTTFNLEVGITDEALQGIVCGDKFYRASSLEEAQPGIETYLRRSKWFGDVLALNQHGFECSQWRFEAKERYNGDFKVTTKNPLLFIGNTYDPVTSLESAMNMSTGFKDSVLLEHGGFGHLSFTDPSNCTDQYIRDYFTNGTLPATGTKCEPNNSPLSVTLR